VSPPLLDGDRERERGRTSPKVRPLLPQTPSNSHHAPVVPVDTPDAQQAATAALGHHLLQRAQKEGSYVCRSHYVVRTTHGLDSRRSTGFPVLSAVTWPISHRSDYLLLPWIRWIYRLIGWRAFRTHKRFASANKLASIMSRCR